MQTALGTSAKAAYSWFCLVYDYIKGFRVLGSSESRRKFVGSVDGVNFFALILKKVACRRFSETIYWIDSLGQQRFEV